MAVIPAKQILGRKWVTEGLVCWKLFELPYLLKRGQRRLYDSGLFPRMVYISNYLGPVQVLYFTSAEFNATIEKNLVFSFIYIRLGKMWNASQLETRHYVTVFFFFLLVKNDNIIIKKELNESQFWHCHCQKKKR